MNGAVLKLRLTGPDSTKGMVSAAEFMVSAAIMSLISAVVLGIFLVTQFVWNDSIINVKLQESAKEPMQMMIRELKEADPASPTGITIGAGNTSITFAVPATSSSSAITSWTSISYSFNSGTGQITRTSNAQTSTIGRNLTTVSFTQSGNTIRVTLTATGTTANNKTLTTTLTSQAAMRK